MLRPTTAEPRTQTRPPLPAGAALIRSRQAEPERDSLTAADSGLRPFYFMVIFWGPVYREYFADLLLASLLSPHNIPALDGRRKNKFLIATTRQDWDALQEHPLFQRLGAYAEPVWIALDVGPDDHKMDRKMGAMSRGHMLVASRAFQDRAYGVFLTPDMILSDGSVAALERSAAAGKRVVLAVAIRYQHEPILAELEQAGYLKQGQPLAIDSRHLMGIALRHLHSETRRYEYDSPWFASVPISVYWQVRGGDGLIIHSFSWAPLVVDYGALSRHDTKTFEQWTLDGDYIYRNFPAPADIHVVADSDEVALVSFTKESDLHFELRPYLGARPRWITDWYKTALIRTLKDSSIMDPVKRNIFPTPVYLHAAEVTPLWGQRRNEIAPIMARACGPVRGRDHLAAAGTAVLATDLFLRLGSGDAPTNRLLWYWQYRRFAWQRLKEKVGLARGRSRLDDGRDWLSPTYGLMNPIWTLRERWQRRRFVWQRLKEKLELARGRSRWDDGHD